MCNNRRAPSLHHYANTDAAMQWWLSSLWNVFAQAVLEQGNKDLHINRILLIYVFSFLNSSPLTDSLLIFDSFDLLVGMNRVLIFKLCWLAAQHLPTSGWPHYSLQPLVISLLLQSPLLSMLRLHFCCWLLHVYSSLRYVTLSILFILMDLLLLRYLNEKSEWNF